MPEFERVNLTLREIEAAVKALDECGANNEFRRLMEVFHDPELMNAAKSCRRELIKRQRSVSAAAPEPLRELARQREDENRRSALQTLRGDYADLIGSVRELLEALLQAREMMRSGGLLEARAMLERTLDSFTWRDDVLAQKLNEIEEARALDLAEKNAAGGSSGKPGE